MEEINAKLDGVLYEQPQPYPLTTTNITWPTSSGYRAADRQGQRCRSTRFFVLAISDPPYPRRHDLHQPSLERVIHSVPDSRPVTRASANLASAVAYLPPSWHLTIWFVTKRERTRLKCLLLNRIQENMLSITRPVQRNLFCGSGKVNKNWFVNKSSGQHKRRKRRFHFLWFKKKKKRRGFCEGAVSRSKKWVRIWGIYYFRVHETAI
jgi:hypothetical protein